MAKDIVHIGLSVATDGVAVIPGKCNVIHLAACGPGELAFEQNILPQSGSYIASRWWDETHPEEGRRFRRNRVSLTEALARFETWRKKFQGNFIAACSNVDFWHVMHMYQTCGVPNPFGTYPYDTNTGMMSYNGHNVPQREDRAIRPSEIAHERWQWLAQGQVKFGKPPKKRAGGILERLGQARLERAEMVPPAPPPAPMQGDVYNAVPPRMGRTFQYNPLATDEAQYYMDGNQILRRL